MYRALILISMIVLLATAGCQASGITSQMVVAEAANEAPFDQAQIQKEMDETLAGMVIPAVLPDTIQDPLLMQGWIALYNRQDPLELWEGYSTSGRQLALYVIDHAVVITWNTDMRFKGSWVDRAHTGTIYVTLEIKNQNGDQITRLVGTLAHELFHHGLPFGQIEDTLYEEYWAFYVGANVSGQGQASFYYTNPLNITSLKSWFTAYNRPGYLDELVPYPAIISAGE